MKSRQLQRDRASLSLLLLFPALMTWRSRNVTQGEACLLPACLPGFLQRVPSSLSSFLLDFFRFPFFFVSVMIFSHLRNLPDAAGVLGAAMLPLAVLEKRVTSQILGRRGPPSCCLGWRCTVRDVFSLLTRVVSLTPIQAAVGIWNRVDAYLDRNTREKKMTSRMSRAFQRISPVIILGRHRCCSTLIRSQGDYATLTLGSTVVRGTCKKEEKGGKIMDCGRVRGIFHIHSKMSFRVGSPPPGPGTGCQSSLGHIHKFNTRDIIVVTFLNVV